MRDKFIIYLELFNFLENDEMYLFDEIKNQGFFKTYVKVFF